MRHPDIKMILATGGPNMVKAAYSSGKPALGVGAGNVPAYVEKSADVLRAVLNIRASKTFDNGLICASEQAVVVDEVIRDNLETAMMSNGYYFLNSRETALLSDLYFSAKYTGINPNVIGKRAADIA